MEGVAEGEGEIDGSGARVAVGVGVGLGDGVGVGADVGIGTGIAGRTSRSWISSTSSTLSFELYVPTARILLPTKVIRLKPTGTSRVTASVEVVTR